MHSALYVGWVRHRRLTPRPHAFRQRLYMSYLDLAELERVFAGRWLWGAHRWAWVRFRRSDFLGDARQALDEAVRDEVQRQSGIRPDGPIRMLTNLAHLGYNFNPVTFYYCFDVNDERVEHIVAEITNTPWGERHAYVLQSPASTDIVRRRFAKTFHVSPFLPLRLNYDWRFSAPGESLAVHMDVADGERKLFDATLVLKRREINAASLASTLMRFPAMPATAVANIYWHALRLWMKRTPVHDHPSSRLQPAASPTPQRQHT